MRGTPFLFEGWVGGLNTISSPYNVLPTESRDCLNVVGSSRGSILKRYGSTLFTESPPTAELQTMVPITLAGEPSIIAAAAGKLYSVSHTGVVTTIGEGFSSNRWCVVVAPKSTAVSGLGPVYLTNGVDAPQTWSGSGSVTEWTGLGETIKATDGSAPKETRFLSSATADFVPEDVGTVIEFESTVEYSQVRVKEGTEEVIGIPLKTATIEGFISNTEVLLELPSELGWHAAYTGVHFKVKRQYYEDPSSKRHVPDGKYMIFAGNRIWMTGIAGDPTAVRFSETAAIGEGGEQADPSQWPALNVVRFDGSDGNPITGIGVVGPYVLVFKERKTWVIHDLDTGENRRLADTIGCVAQRSIVETTHGTFFLTSDQGVYLTDGSKLTEMSFNVRPTILAINAENRSQAAGGYFNNHYYLSFPSGSSAANNRTLDYDVQLKAWWPHDLACNQWAVWEPTSGETSLYGIPPGAGAGVVNCFVPGIYTDSGKNYTGDGTLGAYWRSSWEPFAYYVFRHRIKAPFLKKRVRQVFFDGEGEIVPLVYKNFQVGGRQEPATVNNENQAFPHLPVNFASTDALFGEGEATFGEGEELFGGESPVSAARVYSPGAARVWGYGFGNNSAEPFDIFSCAFMISFRKS